MVTTRLVLLAAVVLTSRLPPAAPAAAIFQPDGRGRFEKAQALDLGNLPTALLLVDIDKDGDLDLVANRGSRETGRTEVLFFEHRTTAPGSSGRKTSTWRIR